MVNQYMVYFGRHFVRLSRLVLRGEVLYDRVIMTSMSLVIIINICVNYHIGHSKSCTLASIMVNQYMAYFGLLLLMLSRVVLRVVGTT